MCEFDASTPTTLPRTDPLTDLPVDGFPIYTLYSITTALFQTTVAIEDVDIATASLATTAIMDRSGGVDINRGQTSDPQDLNGNNFATFTTPASDTSDASNQTVARKAGAGAVVAAVLIPLFACGLVALFFGVRHFKDQAQKHRKMSHSTIGGEIRNRDRPPVSGTRSIAAATTVGSGTGHGYLEVSRTLHQGYAIPLDATARSTSLATPTYAIPCETPITANTLLDLEGYVVGHDLGNDEGNIYATAVQTYSTAYDEPAGSQAAMMPALDISGYVVDDGESTYNIPLNPVVGSIV
jgi:hypothetical protein